MTTNELIVLFMSELRRYNNTNFKTLSTANLHAGGDDPMVSKAFSSVITRYFIFREKHPEISDEENKILYYKLGIDLIAKYFSEYPETSTDNLIGFQVVLKSYVKEHQADIASHASDAKAV